MAVEATYSTPCASSVPLTRGGGSWVQCALVLRVPVPPPPLPAGPGLEVQGGYRAMCGRSYSRRPGCTRGHRDRVEGPGLGRRVMPCALLQRRRPLAALALGKPAPPAAFAAHVARPARLTAQVRDHLELAPAVGRGSSAQVAAGSPRFSASSATRWSGLSAHSVWRSS